MGYLREMHNMQGKLDELYIKNAIVRHCIDSGKDRGVDIVTTLTETVIAIASHNEELKGMLLKIQMEMPAQALKLGEPK